MKGPRLLAAYLRRQKMTYEAFAQEVGTSKSLVCMWLRAGSYARTPSGDFRFAIQKATGGKVPAESWCTNRFRAA